MPSTTAAVAAESKLFSFNSSPLALPSFLEFLRNHIPSCNANFRSLIRNVTITTSGNRPRTVCMSTAHLIASRDGLLNDYSFDKLPPQPFDKLEAVCRQAIFAANTAACLRDGGTHGQYQYHTLPALMPRKWPLPTPIMLLSLSQQMIETSSWCPELSSRVLCTIFHSRFLRSSLSIRRVAPLRRWPGTTE